jgi:hypothetical protein
MKTIWNIVKSITGGRSVSNSPQSVSINGVITENQQLIADSFQNHFLSTVDKLISNISNIDDAEDNSCIVRFEVFTVVTMKNAVFCDVTVHEPHGVTAQKTPFFNSCIDYLY